MPLFWLSLTFLFGIFVASVFNIHPYIWLAGSVLSAVLGVLYRKYLQPRLDFSTFEKIRQHKLWQRLLFTLPFYSLLIAFGFGAAWYQFRLPDTTHPEFIANHIDDAATWVVRGTIVEFPDDLDTYQRLVVDTELIRPEYSIQHAPIHGRLMVRTSSPLDFRYGDAVVIQGIIHPNTSDTGSSYQRYLERQGIYASMSYPKIGILQRGHGRLLYSLLMDYRQYALRLAQDFWPQPESSLLSGILLGVETGIPDPVYEAFSNTGTSHIIAISGFNITLIAGLFASLSGRVFNHWRSLLVSIVGVAIYTLLVGADAAVVRAAFMGGLALFGRQIGRKGSGLNTLAITAAVMALFDPHVLWDIGFQLSFAATLGLVLYADPLSQWFINLVQRWMTEDRAEKLSGPVGEYLLFTLAANITTIPLILLYSGGISLLSPLVNLLILPVQPAIMILGGLAVLSGSVLPLVGRLLGYLAWPFAFYTIRIVEWMDRASIGMINTGEINPLWIVAVYATILGATWFSPEIKTWWGKQEDFGQKAFSPLMVGLFTAALIGWHTVQRMPDGNLHIHFLNTGTSNAVLVETPTGRWVLINGGESSVQLTQLLGRRLPLTNRRLDCLVVGSPASSQIGALEDTIQQYPPRSVLWSGLPSPNRQADYLRQTITKKDIPLMFANTGDALDLGEGARLEVLSTSSLGGIYLFEWGKFRAILPVGSTPEELLSVSQNPVYRQPAFILSAAHGYAPANPPEWIHNLQPKFIVLTVAAGDRDGLPDQEFLDTVDAYPLLRTDQHGWIEITTDGEQLWVDVQSK